MTSDSVARSARPGLSLYANLLDPSSDKDFASSTISRGPIVFKQPVDEDPPQDKEASEKQQISAASLRFQPTKRPQLLAQKSKPKPPISKPPTAPPPTIVQDVVPFDSAGLSARLPVKTTLADWTAEGQDNNINELYGREKRQRGGKKRRKKTKEEFHAAQNWDDIYDPCRPNSFEDYKHSDEKVMEIREWKEKLYAHRLAKKHDSEPASSGNEDGPALNQQLAPQSLSFAPPPLLYDDKQSQHDRPTAQLPNDPTGDDVNTKRFRFSSFNRPSAENPNSKPLVHQIEPLSVASSPSPWPPLPASNPLSGFTSPLGPPPASIAREPVRYNFPAAPSEIPTSDTELEDALRTEFNESPADESPRSLRPGQKGFAERLMSKYGWSKGSGLGASGSGIVNPLHVKIEKQKKKPDSEGGGFLGPGGRGKILGGKKGGLDAVPEDGKFGAMSEVIVLRGMVDGMDLDAEMEGSGDGGLMQEIGEECGDKYGRVERVFIDRSDVSKAPVFVKFTSQLSALRAVNALEGRIFNGNVISARFFNNENFEAGDYK